ncbi:restriction endonuclease subunit S [Candidatus Saccharibacteria bacterium]|nr:restriction endonuclease subunit S [Candidatus Saccharibacteria bacterium]
MEYKKLGEVANVTKLAGFEFTKHIKYTNNGEIIAIRALNLKDGRLVLNDVKRISKESSEILPRSKLHKYDIVLSYTGTIGEIAQILEEGKYHLAPNVAKITPNRNAIDPEFLFQCMKSHEFRLQMVNYAHGSTQPTVPMATIRELMIPVYDLETQKRIVRILSALDQKIELINCENCTIENTLQSHFNNWIDNMKPIATVGLDEIAKYTNGLAMQKFRPGDNDLGLPVVKIKEMNSGISKDTERCTSELKEEYTVFPGDVLFAWSGTLCIKIWDGEVAGLNQHIFKVTSDEYPKWFYYFWTKKHLERFINIAKGKATTMGHIQRKELSLSKVLIPSEHELKKQDETFRPLLEKIICNNSQRQSLLHLRDALLPKLMSGEINI